MGDGIRGREAKTAARPHTRLSLFTSRARFAAVLIADGGPRIWGTSCRVGWEAKEASLVRCCLQAQAQGYTHPNGAFNLIVPLRRLGNGSGMR